MVQVIFVHDVLSVISRDKREGNIISTALKTLGIGGFFRELRSDEGDDNFWYYSELLEEYINVKFS